jgi:RND family efflux transporter MFP subunit
MNASLNPLATGRAARLALLLFAAGLPAARGGAADPATAAGITEPFLDVTLASPVAGILSVQKFREGDFVKEGDVLFELDKRLEELETARRKLVFESRQKDFEATQVLFKTTKAVSKDELDKKETEFKVAAVEHDMAAEQLRRRLVSAPLAGTITEIFLDVGEACQPYQPLVRVVDTRQCYFVSNVEAKLAAGLKVGQTVRLDIETGAAPPTVSGKIIFLSPVVDPASGLLKVKVLFDNTAGKVRPGLAARMHLEHDAHAN